ncbi:MAG: hypothetical protein EA355_10405 [Rhodobacteraceae bacterium]|nr:MAG: hypothetical protein EA355_10405 [Paracoccaceae bacterium]
MVLDIDDVVGRMTLALKSAVGADVPVARGYAATKARAVTHYADLIASAYAAGAIDDEAMKRELAEIEHMTRRFTQNTRGLAGATAEKAAREVVGVLFGAIRLSLGLAGSPMPAGLTERG